MRAEMPLADSRQAAANAESKSSEDDEPVGGMLVAYLLNIWILGPVAPLTGQYSRGGLN